MAQRKLRPRFYTVLFFVAVFFLTSVGLAALHYNMLPSSLLIVLFYLMAWALLFALAVDFFGGKDKFSGKKILVLIFGVMLVSTLFTHLVWTIITPRWSFSVSTDKSVYELGETVTITASLMNMGFITHSFKSASDKPIYVIVEYLEARYYGYEVWYTPLGYDIWEDPRERNVTEFSVGPNETLERNFSWNQTNTSIVHHWNQTYMPGTYRISAYIPRDTAGTPSDNIFSAWTRMNITSI